MEKGEMKPLVMLGADPVLKALDDRMAENKREAIAKIDELQAMAKRIGTVSNEQCEGIWSEIEAHLRGLQLLPTDYSNKRYTLIVKDGVLFLKRDGDTNDCGCVLCKLLGPGMH